MADASPMSGQGAPRWLDRIERIGNRLPDPATLFLAGTLVIVALSALAAALDWSVTRALLDAGSGTGRSAEVVRARSLLAADGLWWLTSHAVENFIRFPPLGIVLVGMLGIGVAERSGLLGAAIRAALTGLHGAWITPSIVFLGVMSSLGLDAGYVVLPPLAAALYTALGRPPLAGVAAAFAGVSAGFSANLFVTAVDPMLAGFTEAAARLVDADYRVAATANWYFMIASTVVLSAAGWAVTALWVEPRLGGTAPAATRAPAPVSAAERRGLCWALGAALGFGVLLLAAVLPEGAPLAGHGARFPRWVETIVPIMAVGFFLPGLAYGIGAGTIGSDRDVARMLGQTMAGLGPYVVLAFFAAQFIACFGYSRLGEMTAIAGGAWLAQLALPHAVLVLVFVAVVMLGNLFVGSASAKYAFFAPVFVPMFMQVGISPELTQAAYRVGDSVTNVVTPFNPYMVIILAEVKRHAPDSGLGTIVALMLPYALVFALAWALLLGGWLFTGTPLGPGGVLGYP